MKFYLWVFFLVPVFALADGVAPPSATKTTPDCQALYNAKDFIRAKEACTTAAEKGNSQARYLLGRMYEVGEGVTQDDATAVKWYRLAADAGHGTSQRRLAGAYYRGLGIKKDDAQAAYWLQEAAKNGDRRAQKQLSVAYKWGLGGLPSDEKLSREWRERAEKNPN